MIGKILLTNFGLLFVFMSLGFLVAKKRNRLDTVDVFWGLGFVLVAWSVMVQVPSGLSLLVATFVTFWGIRLAMHIYKRHKKTTEDSRYIEIAGKWRGNKWPRAYPSIFLLQGLLVWLVSLPIVMASNKQRDGLGWLITLGSCVWIVGFIIEALADRQLRNFLKQKDHPRIMRKGLWRYSRHPNYFGELLQWWGIGIMALSASFGWVGLAGPLLLSYLIIFVSGIPPIERKRKNDSEYRAYKAATSALILLPPRK